MAGVIVSLALLGFAFWLAEQNAPPVDLSDSTCLAKTIPDCTSCLRQVILLAVPYTSLHTCDA